MVLVLYFTAVLPLSVSAAWTNLAPEDGAQGGTYRLESNSDSFAVQFHATAEFTSIGVNLVSYNDNIGTIVFELFRWNGSFTGTVDRTANPPVASKTCENFTEGRVWFDGFQPQPAGEYVMYATTPNAEEGVGIWTQTGTSAEPIRFYASEAVKAGECVNIFVLDYPAVPEVLYGPLSPADNPAPTTVPATEPEGPTTEPVRPTTEPVRPTTEPAVETGSAGSGMICFICAVLSLCACLIIVKQKSAA